MNDSLFGFDPTLPISVPLANICFAFAVVAMVGAVEEPSLGLAITSMLLAVAGATSWYRLRQAKKRDDEKRLESNSEPSI